MTMHSQEGNDWARNEFNARAIVGDALKAGIMTEITGRN
jgi:hypothetical protein